MTTKIYTKCGKEKDILDFHRHIRKPLGIRSDCKDCVKKYTAKNKNRNAVNWKKYSYNLTQKDYNKLIKQQNNKCAICGQEFGLIK